MIHNDNTSKVAAVICEYNPFHAGHAYHLAKTRSLGATHIVAIMSGSFVQRGEPAMFSKWSRAKCALAGGADLVLELPLPWCMSSAESFARGGVALAHGLGCVDLLSFGSELGEISPLLQAAEAAISPLIQEKSGFCFQRDFLIPRPERKQLRINLAQTFPGCFRNPTIF